MQSRTINKDAGTGTERMIIDYRGKVNGTKIELNFVTNRKTRKVNTVEIYHNTLIQIAIDVEFTQMSATAWFQKHG